MTCDEFEQLLLDSQHRVIPEGWMLRASKAALIQEHVNSCRTCATRMGEISRLEKALDHLRVSRMHIEAPPSVEKELLRAFRERAARRHLGTRLAFSWKLAWLAAATLTLVVTSLLMYSKLKPNSTLTEKTERSGSERVISPRSVPVIASAASGIDRTQKPSPTNPRSTPKRRLAQAGTGITQAGRVLHFVPVSDSLSLNGGGSVVRVTLPVSSLAAMGVPVRPDLSENRVTADVWRDPFGAVEGVRLVPANANAH